MENFFLEIILQNYQQNTLLDILPFSVFYMQILNAKYYSR